MIHFTNSRMLLDFPMVTRYAIWQLLSVYSMLYTAFRPQGPPNVAAAPPPPNVTWAQLPKGYDNYKPPRCSDSVEVGGRERDRHDGEMSSLEYHNGLVIKEPDIDRYQTGNREDSCGEGWDTGFAIRARE